MSSNLSFFSRDVETERPAAQPPGTEETEPGQPGEDGGGGEESDQESLTVQSSGL